MRSASFAAVLLLAAALPIAGCATTGGRSTAPTAIDRAGAAYDRIHRAADVALPYLPASTAARVRAGLAIADAAMAIARGGSTPADREAALHELTGAVATIVAALATR